MQKKKKVSPAQQTAAGKNDKYGYRMGKAVGVGLLTITLLLLLFSFLMTQVDLPFSMLKGLTLAAVVAGGFLSGWQIGRQTRSHGMANGALAGMLVMLICYLAAIWVDGSFDLSGLGKILIGGVSGAIGGVLGVNHKTKRI